MNSISKRLIWTLAILVVAGAAGSGLYFTGNLPLGGGESVAVADTTGAEVVVEDDKSDEPEVMAVPVELAQVEGLAPLLAFGGQVFTVLLRQFGRPPSKHLRMANLILRMPVDVREDLPVGDAPGRSHQILAPVGFRLRKAEQGQERTVGVLPNRTKSPSFEPLMNRHIIWGVMERLVGYDLAKMCGGAWL